MVRILHPRKLEFIELISITTDLLSDYLKPLEHILSKGDPLLASKLLSFYTELLRNWTIVYSHRTPDREDLDVEATTIRKFIKHVGQMCLIVQHVSYIYHRREERSSIVNMY